MTLQLPIVTVATAIDDRLQRKLDYGEAASSRCGDSPR
jgi:hypothetical protein